MGLYKLFSFLGGLCLTMTIMAQPTIFEQPLSDRVANYQISAILDTAQKMMYASETIEWINLSNDTVPDWQFHLYLNAFRNTQSTFLQEARGRFENDGELTDEDWGWVHIDSIWNEAGQLLNDSLHFFQPDDDNDADQTVARLWLPQPALPGDTVRMKLKWTSKIPEIKIRTGYSRDYFLNVQWYPKLGVYESAGMRGRTRGGWNCHQYHASAEYYGEFGNYQVDVTVPKSYQVGGTGMIYKETEQEDTKTVYFHAEDVIDFAWVASPEFEIIEDQWKHVNIRLFIIPEYTCCTERYLSSAKNAMEYLDEHLGIYPFNTLTIVVPPLHGINSGGMEYPTFITTPGTYAFPTNIRSPEYFVVHELVHQYFMMMIATNEMEEAWMDEGFTSYYKSRILDYYYGSKSSVINYSFFQMGAMEFFRSRYLNMDNPKIAEIPRPGWEFPYGGYRNLVYAKAAIMLRTLEGVVGREVMDLILKRYFEKWKFKHPGAQDFINIVNEVVAEQNNPRLGDNMNLFFEQILYGTDVCDYAVASIDNEEIPRTAYGIYSPKGVKMENRVINQHQPKKYRSRVVLNRLGEVQLPVEVLVRFADGTEQLEYWDGQARATDFSYETDVRIVSATIDPEKKLFLDKNFLNNTLHTQPETGTLKQLITGFLLKVQHALQAVSFLV